MRMERICVEEFWWWSVFGEGVCRWRIGLSFEWKCVIVGWSYVELV